MKKLFIFALTLALLTLCVSAVQPPVVIDTSDAVEVYRNTFDDEDSLNDFTMYSGSWGIEDGKAYVLPGQTAANAYFVYTGEKEALHDLTDYVVEVDMYNVRQAAGIVARCDLDTCNTNTHGYMGINANFNTAGTYAYNRVTSDGIGKATVSLGSSPAVFLPGANLHLELAMRDEVVQYSITNIDTGLLLWTRTATTELCPSGSFGLMAYTKVVNGLDNSETRFDNLVVKTLTPISEGENFTVVSGSADQYGSDRIDSTSNGMLAIHKTLTMKNGTVEAQLFMPAAATAADFETIAKGQKRIDCAGLIFNYADDGSSYYKLQMYRRCTITAVSNGAISTSSTKVYTELYKVVDGAETLLKTFDMEASGLGSFGVVNLRAVVNDGVIHCYMNERCYVSITDDEPLTGTGVGVFADLSDTEFANFNVTSTTECDKADIVIWGHSHPGGWYHAADEFGKYGKIANLALGGSSTLDMPNVVDAMASYEPKVAIIMIGSNNMSNTVEQNVSDLDDGFNLLREQCPDIKILLITEWWQPARLETYGSYVLQLNEAYREYAKGTDDVTIIEGWNIPVDENGKLDESLFKDTQHLNYLGYDMLNARTHAALAWAIDGNEGDVNGDGEVKIDDVLASLKSMLNSGNYLTHADRNFDGAITLVDILRILKVAVK